MDTKDTTFVSIARSTEDTLADVTHHLVGNGIDITTMTFTSDSIRLLADNVDAAVDALEKAGIQCSTTEAIEADASGGSLPQAVKQIVEAGGGIKHCMVQGGRIYVECSDPQAAKQAMQAATVATA